MTRSQKSSNETSRKVKKARHSRATTTVKAVGAPQLTPMQVLFQDVLKPSTRKENASERRQRQAGLSSEAQVVGGKVRAALYIRVSTDKSVQSDLSMPDQEAQLIRFCDQQGWEITEKYYEPGASAKSTARKVFREMMNDASSEGEPPFDKILIHNSSRFARSMKDYMLFEALLHHRGIEILSITQTFAKDVGGMVALRMTNLMDEFHSRRSSEDSMRTRHAMIEKGFWPGGVSPHGYKCVPSPLNSQRSILAIDEDESDFVRLVYKWAVYGDGQGAPMGVKAIVRAANEQGYRTRNGSRWSTQ